MLGLFGNSTSEQTFLEARLFTYITTVLFDGEGVINLLVNHLTYSGSCIAFHKK